MRSARLRIILVLLAGCGVSPALAQLSTADFETPEFYANWGLSRVNAAQAYAMGFTGAGVKIGIADSPIQLSHPEFSGRVYSPVPFPFFPVANVDVPDHGTHVMGLASAARNEVGMMGVAFDAQLASVLATPADGYPEPGDWAQALIDAEVAVMNGSFGPPTLPGAFLDADRTIPNPNYRVMDFQAVIDDFILEDLDSVSRLAQADVVMVFAAGNEYLEQPIGSKIPSGAGMIPLVTPANTRAGELYRIISDGDLDDPDTWEYSSFSSVGNIDGSIYSGALIAVVATDQNNRIADFSNGCGAAADWCMAAPGVELLSALPMFTYGLESGTSMAAPMVAGGAALVRQAFPYMTARQVIEVVLTTATELGDASIYGHGLLNLERAVKGPIEFGHPSLVPGNTSIFAPIFAVDTQGYDSVWGNDIAGTGGFSKAGEGVLTLTGNNSYGGPTTITGGVLQVNGSIASSDLTVSAGGTLQGTGTVGNTLMAGTLAPGQSIGTLSVLGDLSFSSGARYIVEIDLDRADLLEVSGDVSIDPSANLDIEVLDGIRLGVPYRVLNAQQGLNGQFILNQPFNDLLFLEEYLEEIALPERGAAARGLSFVVDRNSIPMAAYAQTGNQRAVAMAIDTQSPGAEAFNQVIAIEVNETDRLPGLYQSLSGELYSSNRSGLIRSGRLFRELALRQAQGNMNPFQSGLQPVSQYNQRQSDAQSKEQGTGKANAADKPRSAWVQPYGAWGQIGASADALATKTNDKGIALGFETTLSEGFRIGASLGYNELTTDVTDRRASNKGYHGLLYANTTTRGLNLTGGLSYSWYDSEIGTQVDSRAPAVFAELGLPLKQESAPLQWQPYVRLDQAWMRTDGFSDPNIGGGLSGEAASTNQGAGTLGIRVDGLWEGAERSMTLSAMAGWQHGWGDLSPETRMRFETGEAFIIKGAPLAKDALVLDLGTQIAVGPSQSIRLSYSATLDGKTDMHSAQAAFHWRF